MKTQRMFDSQWLRSPITEVDERWDGELYLVEGGFPSRTLKPNYAQMLGLTWTLLDLFGLYPPKGVFRKWLM